MFSCANCHDEHTFKRTSREFRADSALGELSRTNDQDFGARVNREGRKGGSNIWRQRLPTRVYEATSFADDKPTLADDITPMKVEALKGCDLAAGCIRAMERG